jgi:ABC-2 type transport system permease protein
VRLGLARGGIEIRQTLTYWPDLLQALVFSGLSIGVLFLMRGHHVPGTTFSLRSLTLPSIIGMNVAVGGVNGVSALLVIDREDGTLLRAKATPSGMTAYVLGKITLTAATVLIGLAVTMILGLLAFPGLHVTGAGWFTLVWVTVLPSPAGSSRTRSACTTRRSATWSAASTARACSWRCASPSTSACRSR